MHCDTITIPFSAILCVSVFSLGTTAILDILLCARPEKKLELQRLVVVKRVTRRATLVFTPDSCPATLLTNRAKIDRGKDKAEPRAPILQPRLPFNLVLGKVSVAAESTDALIIIRLERDVSA